MKADEGSEFSASADNYWPNVKLATSSEKTKPFLNTRNRLNLALGISN
jgi:hypothetical protein